MGRGYGYGTQVSQVWRLVRGSVGTPAWPRPSERVPMRCGRLLLGFAALGSSTRADDQCDGPLDCNGKNCFECSCTDHKCQCADGWSGPHCETPFCNATSGCSGHGSCAPPQPTLPSNLR